MKEKAIFIISIILVIAGISYLGFTAYKFFTRDTNSGGNTSGQEEQTTDTSSLKMTNSSNQEIIVESPVIGSDVSLKSTLSNESENLVATTFEGRAYKIDEIFTFPNVDTDLPVDSKTITVTLNPNETKEFEYVFTPNSCGIYYMALADQNYWTKGRGLITYGYIDVACDGSTGSEQGSSTPSTGAGQGSGGDNLQGTTDEGLTPVDNNNTQSGLVNIQQGTKGDASTTTPTPTTTKGGEQVNELPKSGPTETLYALGLLSILSAFAYRLKVVRK